MPARPSSVSIQLRLMGPPSILAGGREALPDTRKATALLAYLVLRGPAVPRDSLITLLWPDSAPDRGRPVLRRTLSALRGSVGEGAIVSRGDAIVLVTDQMWVDLLDARALMRSTSKHGHVTQEGCPSCVEPLTAASELLRRDFMEGFALRDSYAFEEWHRREAENCRRDFCEVQARLVDAFLATGDVGEALGRGLAWLEMDPLNETAYQTLMRLQSRNGDRAGALQTYRRCVATLDSELGVAPLPETMDLHDAILEDRSIPESPASTPIVTQPPKSQPDVVGRVPELAAILSALTEAGSTGRVVAIEGEPGIGKTFLADAACAAASLPTIKMRCYVDESHVAYAPIVRGLREAAPPNEGEDPVWAAELGHLLPELTSEVDRPKTLVGASAQARLMEAIKRRLMPTHRPTVLLVDDVQWADDASLDAIAYMVRSLRLSPGAVVLTWRKEDVGPAHRLRRLVSGSGGTTVLISLDRFALEETAELVRLHQEGDSDELADAIHKVSDGLPLIAASYLREGVTSLDPISADVQEMFRARIANSSSLSQQILTAGSVFGSAFSFDEILEAGGRSMEETVGALDELVGRDLLRDHGERNEAEYDFSHELLRVVVYSDASLARRRLLHGRVADALRDGRSSDAVVARHLQLGGAYGEAAMRFGRAAGSALATHALQEALSHLDAAMALGHPDPHLILERLGDVRTLTGDYRGAINAYETVAAGVSGRDLARIEHRIASVHQREGDTLAAVELLTSALSVLDDDSDELRAQIQADLGLAHHHCGDQEKAALMGQAALATALERQDTLGTARARNVLGILAAAEGDSGRAIEELEESSRLAETASNGAAEVAALNNLALVRRGRGELEHALLAAEKSIFICAAIGDRHREAALHSNLADLLHDLGRGDDANEHLKRSATLFAEVAGVGEPRPAIWRLVEW